MSEFIVPMADEVHANGTLDDQTVREFARASNITLPIPYINADGRRVWKDYADSHEAYDAGVQLINTPHRLNLVVDRYLDHASRQGCMYVDILSSGMNNYRGGDPWNVFKENTLETLKAMQGARNKTGIESSLVTTVKRHLDDGVARALELIELTIRFKREGLDDHNRLQAIHMAGNEEKATCRQFAPVYSAIHDKLGFKNNGIHTGEARGADDIWDAITLPGVKRGTHLLSAVHDPQLMDELRDRGFMISFALSSNEIFHPHKFRNPNEHSIRTTFGHGIPTGIQTDDPGNLNITISGEYMKAHTKYGFNRRELFLMTINTVRHGFGAPGDRQGVLGQLADFNRSEKLALPHALFDLGRSVDLREVVPEIADKPKGVHIFSGLTARFAP